MGRAQAPGSILCYRCRYAVGYIVACNNMLLVNCAKLDDFETPTSICDKFEQEEDHVFNHMRSLLNAATEEDFGLYAVKRAVNIIEAALKEYCNELSASVRECISNYAVCYIEVKCDNKRYRASVSLITRAIIGYIEKISE